MRFKDYYLIEKKDHIIKRIPALSDEQKNKVIDLFNLVSGLIEV